MAGRVRWCLRVVLVFWIHGASIQCEAAWVHNDDNNHVYYFSGNEERTWPEARDECEDRSAYLVTVNNLAENEFLYDSDTGNLHYWIGLRCDSGTCNGDNGLTWVNGNSDYRDFATFAPFADIRYVYIDFDNEDWYGSDSRDNEKRYICEKPDGCHNPSNPCLNGGTCSPNNRGGYTCACKAAFTGQMCQTSLHCASDPCTHGSCSEGADSYICNCDGTGYTGNECTDDIDECSDDSHNCITNNGRCNNTVGSYTCICNAGWTGRRCQTNIDECESDPCQHGGSCNDDVNGYSCSCTVGYTGSHCESDVNECRENTGICNNGTCNNTEGAFTCTCYHGYRGNRCDRDVDECSGNRNICQHQGTCVNTIGSYHCMCVPGYTGQNCEEEIDECDSDPCMNGGTCSDMVNGFNCSCPSNYQGPNCATDVNECLQHDVCGLGNCSNTPGAFTCECPPGYDGLNCTDIDECQEPNPCNSHGNCTNHIGGYSCVCEPGYNDENDCLPHNTTGNNNTGNDVSGEDEEVVALRKALIAGGTILFVTLILMIYLLVDDIRYQRDATAHKRMRRREEMSQSNDVIETESSADCRDSPGDNEHSAAALSSQHGGSGQAPITAATSSADRESGNQPSAVATLQSQHG